MAVVARAKSAATLILKIDFPASSETSICQSESSDCSRLDEGRLRLHTLDRTSGLGGAHVLELVPPSRTGESCATGTIVCEKLS
jgi:hypothetical protein